MSRKTTILPEAQKLCRKYGTLTIADESNRAWAARGAGSPISIGIWNTDIVTVAKALSAASSPPAPS
jgi:adenosylmethionine-8-amino-7-oxononanoate aminotransferase